MGFAGLLHAYSPTRSSWAAASPSAFDLLEPVLRATLRERALPAFREVPVLRAALGEDSGLVGAAALALDTLTAPFPAGDDMTAMTTAERRGYQQICDDGAMMALPATSGGA
jgi:glucokinase